jgi:RNA polymerase sigma-70 factor (ECF subfamily)
MDATATMTADAGQAFAELLQRHRGIVFKVAGSYARDPHDRDDLAQEIAAQLWRAWPKYDPARPFSTWMYRIALNVAISHLRSETHRRRHAVPLDDALHDAAFDDAADADTAEGLRILQRFIATLEPLDRALLLLYLDERSTREMAEVLGISESNVTTKISRLKQRIRAQT